MQLTRLPLALIELGDGAAALARKRSKSVKPSPNTVPMPS
jgi:hypothetical protein